MFTAAKKVEILRRRYETWPPPSYPASFAVFPLTVKSKCVELNQYCHNWTLFVGNADVDFRERSETLT